MMSDQQPEPYGDFLCGMGPAAIMAGLFERAHDRLSDEDLDQLAGGALEDAQSRARWLSSVASGVGCMVHGDQKMRTGAFQQPESLASLLFSIAGAADEIEGLLSLSSSAETAVRIRRADKGGRS